MSSDRSVAYFHNGHGSTRRSRTDAVQRSTDAVAYVRIETRAENILRPLVSFEESAQGLVNDLREAGAGMGLDLWQAGHVRIHLLVLSRLLFTSLCRFLVIVPG